MWVVFLIVGVILSILMPIAINRGKKSRNWPTTEATVISTEVEEKHKYDEDGESVYYYPRVHYDYRVGGQVYQGFKYKLLEASMSKRKAIEFISNFIPGDKLTVYYDPEKPTESVMQPGEQKYLYVFLVIGIGVIVLSLVKLFT
jgi:hypothetical protein